MRTPYNIESLRYFCAKILPLVRRQVPGVQVMVVGAMPRSNILREFSCAPVNFLGFQRDLTFYLRRDPILIAPVVTGSGVRTKIVEAFAQGMAVVSTSMGVSGLSAANGEDILLGDTDEDFAAQVVRVMTNQRLRNRIQAGALARFRDSYRYEAVKEHTLTAYEQIASKVTRRVIA